MEVAAWRGRLGPPQETNGSSAPCGLLIRVLRLGTEFAVHGGVRRKNDTAVGGRPYAVLWRVRRVGLLRRDRGVQVRTEAGPVCLQLAILRGTHWRGANCSVPLRRWHHA